MANPNRHQRQESRRQSNQDSLAVDDGDFELTAEMMIQDELDDETSLLEEEGMENDEAVQEEVSALEKESEMPLEELLAMYGGAANQNAAIEEQKGAEEEKEKEKEDENVSVRLITENGNDDRGPRRGGWMTSQLLESARGGSGDVDRESSSDEEYVSLDKWRKEIQIGEEYQAVIPNTPDTTYVEPVSAMNDKLLWDGNRVDSKEVDSYLALTVWNSPDENEGIDALPLVAENGDSESALYLLKECDYNVHKAIQAAVGRESVAGLESSSSEKEPWTEDDCRSFEIGMQLYGKNFPAIQKNRFPNRTVGEVIHYYYLWKKTEMHDLFAQQHYQNRGGNDYINPGQLVGLEKYGDDADFESSRAPSPLPSTAIAADRGATKPPPAPATTTTAPPPASTTTTTTTATTTALPQSEYWRVTIDGGRKRGAEKDSQHAKRPAVLVPSPPPSEPNLDHQTVASPVTTTEALLASEVLPESSDDSFHESKPH
ncbi:mesoderm induction early response protein 1-like isoform X2 [Oscarella lobularis]|uniref:mesoderm induction early response protein 1-like isoform X2 n=1 Tax=Oscarella lobularis TaxID=121494 RepID=UPI0033143577